MKQIRHLRKGIVIPLVAFCLAVMMGFVAIVVDGGLLLDRQNRMQTVADAAAIAAAEDLFANWRANQGYDPKGTAAAAGSRSRPRTTARKQWPRCHPRQRLRAPTSKISWRRNAASPTRHGPRHEVSVARWPALL